MGVRGVEDAQSMRCGVPLNVIRSILSVKCQMSVGQQCLPRWLSLSALSALPCRREKTVANVSERKSQPRRGFESCTDNWQQFICSPKPLLWTLNHSYGMHPIPPPERLDRATLLLLQQDIF